MEDEDKHPPHAHAHSDDDDAITPHLHLLGAQFEGEKQVTIGEYQVPINPMDEFNCESCQ